MKKVKEVKIQKVVIVSRALTSEEVAGDQWLVASEEEIQYPTQTTSHESQITSVAKRPWCGNLRLRFGFSNSGFRIRKRGIS